MFPANPGGGWDQTGRQLAAAMQSAKLVSSVQFENKGGAGGTIGLAQFINASKGDPNALMMGGMVKAFKTNPGGVSWGGGSAGGTDHILVGLIAKAAGVDPAKINYVPYKGGGEAVAAIVGGHVTAGVSGIGEFAEQVKGGRIRALGVSAPSRVDGIGTLKEQGLDVELANWRGVFGAPGITTPQRDALVKLVKAATDSAAWKATLEKFGWAPIFLAGDDYKKFVEEDTKRIAGIIDSLGIKQKKRSAPFMKAKPAEVLLSVAVLGSGIAI